MGLPAEPTQSESRFAAYLKAESDTGIKHEYMDGLIVAMAGSSPAHSAVASAVLGELGIQLKSSPCQPHGSDFRVRYGVRTFYPDVLVVCPPPQLDPELPHTLLNPRVIVELHGLRRYRRSG
jgi:Uma2 family endonuclease